MYHYKNGVLGGTFDRLHQGHKAFLRFAFSVSEHLYLGLTSDEYVRNHKKVVHALSFEERKKELEAFVNEENVSERVSIIEIHTNEIPDTLQQKADSIIVTLDTLSGAEELNSIRKNKGLLPLPVVSFSSLVTGKNGKIISSTNIRSGEIDRKGSAYITDEMKQFSFHLPPHLRSTLKEPLGESIDTPTILNSVKKNDVVITVGDVTTSTFLAQGIQPTLAVIDLLVQRKKTFRSFSELGFSGQEHVYHIENPKSHIVPSVFILLSHIFTEYMKRVERSVLHIAGEEDLVVLPVILLAPLGTKVFYGQPNEGMVYVEVTEKLKSSMQLLLAQFEKIATPKNH